MMPVVETRKGSESLVDHVAAGFAAATHQDAASQGAIQSAWQDLVQARDSALSVLKTNGYPPRGVGTMLTYNGETRPGWSYTVTDSLKFSLWIVDVDGRPHEARMLLTYNGQITEVKRLEDFPDIIRKNPTTLRAFVAFLKMLGSPIKRPPWDDQR